MTMIVAVVVVVEVVVAAVRPSLHFGDDGVNDGVSKGHQCCCCVAGDNAVDEGNLDAEEDFCACDDDGVYVQWMETGAAVAGTDATIDAVAPADIVRASKRLWPHVVACQLVFQRN